LFKNILDCLEVVNRHVNGQNPSQSFDQTQLDYKLVYALGVILDEGWDLVVPRVTGHNHDDKSTRELTIIFWAISRAWRAILDGDIDSLAQHIADLATANSVELGSLAFLTSHRG
jgi:hypothetical protein